MGIPARGSSPFLRHLSVIKGALAGDQDLTPGPWVFHPSKAKLLSVGLKYSNPNPPPPHHTPPDLKLKQDVWGKALPDGREQVSQSFKGTAVTGHLPVCSVQN